MLRDGCNRFIVGGIQLRLLFSRKSGIKQRQLVGIQCSQLFASSSEELTVEPGYLGEKLVYFLLQLFALIGELLIGLGQHLIGLLLGAYLLQLAVYQIF